MEISLLKDISKAEKIFNKLYLKPYIMIAKIQKKIHFHEEWMSSFLWVPPSLPIILAALSHFLSSCPNVLHYASNQMRQEYV